MNNIEHGSIVPILPIQYATLLYNSYIISNIFLVNGIHFHNPEFNIYNIYECEFLSYEIIN